MMVGATDNVSYDQVENGSRTWWEGWDWGNAFFPFCIGPGELGIGGMTESHKTETVSAQIGGSTIPGGTAIFHFRRVIGRGFFRRNRLLAFIRFSQVRGARGGF